MPLISTCPNRRAKDVLVVAMVVTELELVHVQRQVGRAHLVEDAHDPALHNRPKSLDGVRMNRAHHVLALRVVNEGMRELQAELGVTDPAIGAEQRDLMRDRLADESGQSGAGEIGRASCRERV